MPRKKKLKKVKVIFLDIDGVLWTFANERRKEALYKKHNTTVEQGISDYYNRKDTKALRFVEILDPIACANLNYILENVPDAMIVVSSTWRKGRTRRRMESILVRNKVNAKKRVIGFTPYKMSSNPRGVEISWWLRDAAECGYEVEKYVILDDDSDMKDEQLESFVHTDSAMGLTIHDAALAAWILGYKEDADLLTYRNSMITDTAKNAARLTVHQVEIDKAIEAKREERARLYQEKYGKITSVIP